MKTNNVLKIGFFAVAFALLSVGVKAQTLPSTEIPVTTYTPYTTTGGESVDSVTIGSRMPYKVDAQDPVTGLTFEYKWLFSSGLTVQDLSGITLTGTNDYYTANEVSVVMPTTVGTTVTINTNVRQFAGTTLLCPAGATDDVYSVTVVDRPKIKWAANGVTNSCSATAVSIPLTTLTGYKQFEVKYSINYYANVNKSGTPVTSTGYVVLTGNTLDFPATTFSAEGAYEISVIEITDRISRKSLDMSLVKSVGADLPGDAYNVNIYPAPVTKPLQHVKNM